ncbi:MAG: LPS export ABC transporter permease LptG [Deltaproteobacteria bacterium]|nr:LPS export ABC transporter permease LptG [Deltaproteobacteria bacterium]MBW1994551.1 LPS export ABC transporter permease LptG [Deltaproteobacteria bacterium]MBW2154201.1 LPS export ABC transporter permease LptG [Deltaproteobacteria bacterium]
MSIIYRYLNREIFRTFGIVLVAAICIYIAVDFFEKIDDFMEKGIPFSRALLYFLFNIPFVTANVMPIGLFLAILITFGMMSKHNEIIALKSSGISIYSLLWPVLSIGVLFTILLFFVSEVIVPITTTKANQIWLREVRGEVAITTREKNIWIKGNRTIAHIKFYDPVAQTLHGITLNCFDQDFNLIRRIDAKKAVYKNRKWVLQDMMEQHLNSGNDHYRVYFHEQKTEDLGFSPENLRRVIKKADEMNFKELLEFIRQIEAEGYRAANYKVDLQKKIAFPFVCLVLALLGTGLSFRGKITEGLPVVVAYGLGIAFLYWVFNSFCISLGYGEMLPPWVAAWVANVTFAFIGVFMLIQVQ